MHHSNQKIVSKARKEGSLYLHYQDLLMPLYFELIDQGWSKQVEYGCCRILSIKFKFWGIKPGIFHRKESKSGCAWCANAHSVHPILLPLMVTKDTNL